MVLAVRHVIGIAIGMAALPDVAQAQCRLCPAPTTERALTEVGAARLEVETSLDFDRLVLLGQGEGSATLRPDGSRQVSGVIAAIGGRAMVGSAMIRGEAGRAVRVHLPASIALHSLSGGRVTIDNLVSDLPALPRLDASGALAFRFGGRLTVSGDAEGEYRGDVPITVEYP
jgi:hypothetical protein